MCFAYEPLELFVVTGSRWSGPTFGLWYVEGNDGPRVLPMNRWRCWLRRGTVDRVPGSAYGTLKMLVVRSNRWLSPEFCLWNDGDVDCDKDYSRGTDFPLRELKFK